jgi:hypothetical protein
MEQARLAKDYLDVILWPFLGVTGTVSLFLWLFRVQIREVILRINRIDLPGGSGISTTPVQQETEPPPSPPEGEPPPPDEPPPTVAARDELLRWYTFNYFYERTYRIIFGSQIALLHYLNSQGQSGAEEPSLFVFHTFHLQQARAVNVGYTNTWQSFVGFLRGANLVSQVGQLYFITDLGRSFLQWILAENAPPKAF